MNRFLACAVLAGAFATRANAIFIPTGITTVFPPEDTVLPTNARPIAFVSSVDPFEIVTAEGEPIESERVGINALVLSPGALTANASLLITARCDACDGRVIAWQVGEADDVDSPTFDDGPATGLFVQGFHSGGLITFPAGYEVDLDLPHVNESVLIRLDPIDPAEGEGSFFPDTSRGDDGPTHVHFILDGGDERSECFDAVAVDVAGNETLFSEQLCFELTHDLLEEPATCNCASLDGHSASMLIALGALISRRKGRRSARRAR
jgi:hypothetical protein